MVSIQDVKSLVDRIFEIIYILIIVNKEIFYPKAIAMATNYNSALQNPEYSGLS